MGTHSSRAPGKVLEAVFPLADDTFACDFKCGLLRGQSPERELSFSGSRVFLLT